MFYSVPPILVNSFLSQNPFCLLCPKQGRLWGEKADSSSGQTGREGHHVGSPDGPLRTKSSMRRGKSKTQQMIRIQNKVVQPQLLQILPAGQRPSGKPPTWHTGRGQQIQKAASGYLDWRKRPWEPVPACFLQGTLSQKGPEGLSEGGLQEGWAPEAGPRLAQQPQGPAVGTSVVSPRPGTATHLSRH